LAHEGCHYFIEDCYSDETFYSQRLPPAFQASNLFNTLSEFHYIDAGKLTYIKC
jgi:hypothetical protein